MSHKAKRPLRAALRGGLGGGGSQELSVFAIGSPLPPKGEPVVGRRAGLNVTRRRRVAATQGLLRFRAPGFALSTQRARPRAEAHTTLRLKATSRSRCAGPPAGARSPQ